jgi:membrane protein DedA with SNARE-associated domain
MSSALAHRRHARWALPSVAVAVVAAVVALLVIGDVLPDTPAEAGALARGLEHRFGTGASLVLLYMEESGVPLPVPGDVYVAYVGSRFAQSPLLLVAMWLAIVVVVTAGATNMYLLSRRFGQRLLQHRLAGFLHVGPARMQTAHGWFARWGAHAIIVGRHIPGCRVPVTLAAGTFGVSYRVFAVSVAISTAIWAGAWLLLGSLFGRQVARFMAHHRPLYALLAAGVIAAIAFALLSAGRHQRRGAASELE